MVKIARPRGSLTAYEDTSSKLQVNAEKSTEGKNYFIYVFGHSRVKLNSRFVFLSMFVFEWEGGKWKAKECLEKGGFKNYQQIQFWDVRG